MRLTLLDDRDDLPRPGLFAIGEDGALWRRFRNDGGTWGRGCLAGYDRLAGEALGPHARFVFLRPSWVLGRPALTFDVYRDALLSEAAERGLVTL